MPVHPADPETDEVGPYNRLSASQANTWEDCPRLWWYQSKQRLKFPQTPPLFLGRAVEECVCRVLMESPNLVVSAAPSDVMKIGAENLLPLLPHEQPDDIIAWCEARVDVHWPAIRDAMHAQWNKDARRAGNWHEYSMEAYRDMCVTACRMHLEIAQQHADETGCTINQAWDEARPWFVDPDAEQFSQNAIHPGHWFQGEYDLVYRHGDRIRIMDLKASRGGGDRSGNYVEQLRIYAMLWSSTHDGELPDELEIWYLGVGVRKTVSVPSESEVAEMEQRLNDLWHEIKGSEVNIDDCPPIPRPLRGYAEGGVKIEDPEESRCATCDWAGLCPNGSGDDDLIEGGEHQPPGDTKVYDLTSFEQLKPRSSIFCEIFSVQPVPDKPPNIMVEDSDGFARLSIMVAEVDGEPTYPLDITKGDKVRLVGVVPSTNWKGELQLKVDPHARVIRSESSEEGDVGLFGFRARWNVAGRVAYKTYKSGVSKTGKPWARKGLVLLDATGRIAVEGWDNAWPPIFNTLQQGDEVAVLNVSLDAWAIDVKANMEKGSSFHVLSRAEE